MGEDIIPFFGEVKDQMKNIIKVVGVGGGGCNAVANMYKERVEGVTYAVCNTDSQSLSRSPVPVKIQLGEGLGAGGNPEQGRCEAETNINDFVKLLSDGTKMVFVTAGMGGGTGTGAAPVVAGVAKDMGILTVGVVTLPFKMEMRKRMDKALLGMEALKKCVDSLIVINNQRLLENERYNKLTLEEGLKKADEVLTIATKTIAEIITVKGSINRDYNDVRTVMKDGGAALVSVAKASGEKRIFKALSEAISSPLVANVEKQKVRRLLYIVYSGNQNPARMDELEEISEFMENFDENLDVLWGHYPDETLGDEIKVAVVATGFDQNDGEEGTDVNHAKQDEMKRLKDLREKFYTHAHAASKEDEMPEETCVPIVEQPPVIEHDDDEPEEEDTEEREDAAPKTPTFVEILFGKMKKLMEEE